MTVMMMMGKRERVSAGIGESSRLPSVVPADERWCLKWL